MNEKQIFDHLYEIGCCKYCCLRYVGRNLKEDFVDVDITMKKMKFMEDSCEQIIKKCKGNPCPTCLGLLNISDIETLLDKILNDCVLSEYDSCSFACGVSLPIALQVREHSLMLYLEDTFPEEFPKIYQSLISLKEVWKWIVGPKIAKKINRMLDNGATCDFLITINMSYPDDLKEINSLVQVNPTEFNTRYAQTRKYRGEIFTRKGVESILLKTKPEIFKKHIPCPPVVPDVTLCCESILCTHNSIYFAGRYRKLSRELSQTPWILNGVRMMESSVQEIICDKVMDMFGFSKDDIKFSSSGREDVDVRCLGKGRPFVLEIMNPKTTKFSFEDFRTLENEINTSNVLKVQDMQLIPKSELIHIKDGEESKTKVYKALCVSQEKIDQSHIDIINNHCEMNIEQKTPIRVLHRRPLAVRSRKIHYMKSQLVEGHNNLFTLDLQTQAGTYVKEFVHGDFGRTNPNLSSILEIEVDIIALDVTAINLDWPTSIKYE